MASYFFRILLKAHPIFSLLHVRLPLTQKLVFQIRPIKVIEIYVEYPKVQIEKNIFFPLFY